MQNKYNIRVCFLAIMGLFLILISGCKKEESKKIIPVLTTSPVLTISPISEIEKTEAKSGGNISSVGGLTITACGICWSTNQTPSITDNKTTLSFTSGNYSDTLINLIPNTTYYVRAYATNSLGTGYGNVISFTTDNVQILFNPNLTYGELTDIEGNKYKTIKIGTQTWMAENLKVVHYRNGDPITNTKNAPSKAEILKGAYYDYDNSPENSATYGKLYNWFAVKNDRILAPIGWHIPTTREIQIMIDYLGGQSFAGGKLKEAGHIHWQDLSSVGTNESGFTALPAGQGYSDTKWFGHLGAYGFWWCFEDNSGPYQTFSLQLYGENKSTLIYMNALSLSGYSVRCIMDN